MKEIKYIGGKELFFINGKEVTQEKFYAFDERTYGQKREPEYLPTGDQLDAIFKGLEYIYMNHHEIELPRETVEAILHWRSVKTKIPKPDDENESKAS